MRLWKIAIPMLLIAITTSCAGSYEQPYRGELHRDDPTGDTEFGYGNLRGDITEYGVRYKRDSLTLAWKSAWPQDIASDDAWHNPVLVGRAYSNIKWWIESTNDDRPDYLIEVVVKSTDELRTMYESELRVYDVGYNEFGDRIPSRKPCRGQVNYGVHVVTVDPTCVGGPKPLRFTLALEYMSAVESMTWDQAPNGGSYGVFPVNSEWVSPK